MYNDHDVYIELKSAQRRSYLVNRVEDATGTVPVAAKDANNAVLDMQQNAPTIDWKNSDLTDKSLSGPLLNLCATGRQDVCMNKTEISSTFSQVFPKKKQERDLCFVVPDIFDRLSGTRTLFSFKMQNRIRHAEDVIEKVTVEYTSEKPGPFSTFQCYRGFALDHMGQLDQKFKPVQNDDQVIVPMPILFDKIPYGGCDGTLNVTVRLHRNVNLHEPQLYLHTEQLDAYARGSQYKTDYDQITTVLFGSHRVQLDGSVRNAKIHFDNVQGFRSLVVDMCIEVGDDEEDLVDRVIFNLNSHEFLDYTGTMCNRILPRQFYDVATFPSNSYYLPLGDPKNSEECPAINMHRIENPCLELHLKEPVEKTLDIKITFRYHAWFGRKSFGPLIKLFADSDAESADQKGA